MANWALPLSTIAVQTGVNVKSKGFQGGSTKWEPCGGTMPITSYVEKGSSEIEPVTQQLV